MRCTLCVYFDDGASNRILPATEAAFIGNQLLSYQPPLPFSDKMRFMVSRMNPNFLFITKCLQELEELEELER